MSQQQQHTSYCPCLTYSMSRSSITKPILFAHLTNQLQVHSKPISSILSAQPHTLKPLPTSPHQSPYNPSSSQSSSEEPEEEIPEVEEEEQEAFASAVQSPAIGEVNDLPLHQNVLMETKQITSLTRLKSSPESSLSRPSIESSHNQQKTRLSNWQKNLESVICDQSNQLIFKASTHN
ncbi:uncharacterized protein PGTG_17695 [Puccinia graminis f. sp. tritici CRL 75-36-700-3]|uniref:Uncharacterized protein n=1 Tax=Puccinia graminis f. sp. tritici (strain CRL 75-36-700-3 / race SCCL) TaxID=418459 RepID=E3L4H0_PUCGT|nr:uncharacterized protein PGTG_17695 [Puccinia graminis f. sp. tritici CRL 75-36-700-3]EFP91445.2 hypothetical protein PGTG_17695 [Puccinia graminis f. sp. tritici CRL 75-36-700-3]